MQTLGELKRTPDEVAFRESQKKVIGARLHQLVLQMMCENEAEIFRVVRDQVVRKEHKQISKMKSGVSTLEHQARLEWIASAKTDKMPNS